VNMNKKNILLLILLYIFVFLGFSCVQAAISFQEIGEYQLCPSNSVSIGMKTNNEYLKSFTQKCAKIMVNNNEATSQGYFLISVDLVNNNYNCPFYSFFSGYDGNNLYCKYLAIDNNKIFWNNYYLREFVKGVNSNFESSCDTGSVQIGLNGQSNLNTMYGKLNPLNGINCTNGIKIPGYDENEEIEYTFKLTDSRCDGNIQVNEFEVNPLPGALFYYLILRPYIGSDDYQFEVNYPNKIVWRSDGPMSRWYKDNNQLFFEVTGYTNNHFQWAKPLYNEKFPNVNVVNTYKNYFGLLVPKLNCNPVPNPSFTPIIEGIRGIFISKKINFFSSSNISIKFDNNVTKNSPPGFNELLAPIWKEFTP